jgi:hypothetical protein
VDYEHAGSFGTVCVAEFRTRPASGDTVQYAFRSEILDENSIVFLSDSHVGDLCVHYEDSHFRAKFTAGQSVTCSRSCLVYFIQPRGNDERKQLMLHNNAQNLKHRKELTQFCSAYDDELDLPVAGKGCMTRRQALQNFPDTSQASLHNKYYEINLLML